MKIKRKYIVAQNHKFLLIIVILVLILFFRFTNLEKKVYWGDETYTSLRIAGYKWAEYSQIFDGKEYTIEDIQKYQRLTPEKDLFDTIDSLAVEDPHHPPLYYVLGRFWGQWFGDSVAARRSLPALISLLAFPSTYWLCLELFQSSLTGWVAIALIAVSPFHLLYAQEMREFSLWTVTILLSSAALLRAMRQQTKFSWGIYSVTLALSFYTFLFSVLVAIGHGIYVLAVERFQSSKKILNYLLASVGGLILFFPWIFIVISNLSQIQATNSDKIDRVPLLYLIKTWALNMTHVFVDLQFGYRDPFDVQFGYNNPVTYFIIPTLILIGYAIYFLCCQTSKQVWLFILTLIGMTALALMLPDVVIGGTRSINARYLTPSYLGIELAVAYLLAHKIFAISLKKQQQKLWQIIAVVLISCSVISCVLISHADTWWTKYTDYYAARLGYFINQAERPLVVIDNPWRVLPLSYSLDPQVRVQVAFDSENLPEISGKFSDIFVYNSYGGRSQKFRESFEKVHRSQLDLVYKAELTFKGREISLWKLRKTTGNPTPSQITSP
ncbi:glycosyltransferase family 39 protein [Coleofasciculus sp. LEGE 07092]|nr:glycosyltransferase family 39 protein [Coleofasciculus sp. LEGE 07081]MBE9148993.1 glycosyltransferase family 39 protein [Coleofasciculus sp. LEGE 07092]